MKKPTPIAPDAGLEIKAGLSSQESKRCISKRSSTPNRSAGAGKIGCVTVLTAVLFRIGG
jgi:hypothetical protein